MTTINLDSVVEDTGGNFNTTSHIYHVPATGRYFAQALLRPDDSEFTTAGGPNIGVGIHTSNIDGTWFRWYKVMPQNSGGVRISLDYRRIAQWNASDQLRLYAFHETGVDETLFRASMQIWRIS